MLNDNTIKLVTVLSMQTSGNPTAKLITGNYMLRCFNSFINTTSLVLSLHNKQILTNKGPIPFKTIDHLFPNITIELLDLEHLNNNIEYNMFRTNSIKKRTCPELSQYKTCYFYSFY